jgi:hypothetical protein
MVAVAAASIGLSGNTASINPTSGWGVDQQCLNASSNNGIDCKGTNRSDICCCLPGGQNDGEAGIPS